MTRACARVFRVAYAVASTGEPDPNAIETRIPSLDVMTGGLHRGEYVVIGARPSMGKTALAVQLAMNITEAGGGAAYFSLEMPEALLSPRLLSSKLWHPNRQGPTYQALLNGQVSDIEARYAADAAEEMRSWPFYIEGGRNGGQQYCHAS
jgi:replicative DNA helicase